MKKLIFGSLFCIFMTDISLCSNDKPAYHCSTEKSNAENERTQMAENPIQSEIPSERYTCYFDKKVISFLKSQKVDINIKVFVQNCLFSFVKWIYNGSQAESTFSITCDDILPIIICESPQMTIDSVSENIPYFITSCSVTENPRQFLCAIQDFWNYKYVLYQVTGPNESSAGSSNENATQEKELNIKKEQSLLALLRLDLFQRVQQRGCKYQFFPDLFNTISSSLSERMTVNSFFVIDPKVELHTVSRECEPSIGASMGYTSKGASASGFSYDDTNEIISASDTKNTQSSQSKDPFQIFLIFYKPLCTKIEELHRNIETSVCEQSYIVESRIDGDYCALRLPQKFVLGFYSVLAAEIGCNSKAPISRYIPTPLVESVYKRIMQKIRKVIANS